MEKCFTKKLMYFWQNAENLLIILFLATFTLNIRKVFLTPHSFLNGEFNEYMTPSFSWADLLMLAVIIIYTTKRILRQGVSAGEIRESLLYYNKNNLSRASGLLRIISRLPRTTITNICQVIKPTLKKAIMVRGETIILLLFLVWIGLSIFWSNYQSVALYRFATFLEITLFTTIAIKSLKNQKWLKMALFALILDGLFQSILGITQFIRNKSLGIHWLGESIVGPNIDGVAKVIIASEKHIRAYGTFPHPNILAGFLIIPVFLVLAELMKGFALAKIGSIRVSRGTLPDVIPTWIIISLLVIISTGFLLTFSRSAFLGLVIGLLILCFRQRKLILGQSRLAIIFLFFLAILIGGYFVRLNNSYISLFSTQSLEERNFYQIVSYETISAHPLAGIGIGQFVSEEFQKYPKLEGWQYQPVHNIYLLVFSELGIVGLIFFLLWIFSIMGWGSGKNRNTGLLLTDYMFYCVIFSFLLVFLFDHYFWDIKPGMIVFALPVLFLKVSNNKTGVGSSNYSQFIN